MLAPNLMRPVVEDLEYLAEMGLIRKTIATFIYDHETLF